MTTSSQTLRRRRGVGVAGICLVLLLAGCDTPGFQSTVMLQRYKTDPKGAEEVYRSYFQYEANREKALQEAFGDDVIYVSPEQQESFFSSLDAFMNSVLPGMLARNESPVEDPLVDHLRSLDPMVIGLIKAQNQQFVDKRVQVVRQRAGDYGRYLGSEQIREIVWNDQKYEDFLTDNDYAVSEIEKGVRDAYEGKAQEAGRIIDDLRDATLPVTMPTPQPPS